MTNVNHSKTDGLKHILRSITSPVIWRSRIASQYDQLHCNPTQFPWAQIQIFCTNRVYDYQARPSNPASSDIEMWALGYKCRPPTGNVHCFTSGHWYSKPLPKPNGQHRILNVLQRKMSRVNGNKYPARHRPRDLGISCLGLAPPSAYAHVHVLPRYSRCSCCFHVLPRCSCRTLNMVTVSLSGPLALSLWCRICPDAKADKVTLRLPLV